MTMKCVWQLLASTMVALCLQTSSVKAGTVDKVPKLLLVSMDGFRYDYLDLLQPSDTPNLHYVVEHGVKGKLTSVFPSFTYPNHFSIITGLYPESHSIVHNRFYDNDFRVQDYFVLSDRRDNFDPVWYDNGAEPIYVTNKKGNGARFTASALWPTGLGKVKQVEPDYIYDDADAFSHINFTKMADDMVNWFTQEKHPANLGLLYFEEPDEIAHETGAASTATLEKVKEIDKVIGHLITGLKERQIFDEMNIILLADHGFVNITFEVFLEDFGLKEYDYFSGGDTYIVYNIWPNSKWFQFNTVKIIICSLKGLLMGVLYLY